MNIVLVFCIVSYIALIAVRSNDNRKLERLVDDLEELEYQSRVDEGTRAYHRRTKPRS